MTMINYEFSDRTSEKNQERGRRWTQVGIDRMERPVGGPVVQPMGRWSHHW